MEAWPKDDIRRVFVAGAKWWEYHSTGGTMWQSDQRLAEAEATKRYASQQKDAPVKNCTHPVGYIRSVRICGLCGEQRGGG